MEIPKLKSEKLELLPLSLDCESVYEQFYTDAEASKLYGGPKTSAASFARLLEDAGSWNVLGFGVWAIWSFELKMLVGVCGFWQRKGWPRELTWWLLPDARGRGLARDASKLAILHAYENWHWESVETYMNDENEPARKLAIYLGGKVTERKIFPDGLKRDVYLLPYLKPNLT